MKTRFLVLSRDGQRLEFKGRGQHRIPFKSVMLVAPGRESANFKSKDGDLHRTDPAKFRHLSSLSFSVHYYDVDGFSRSLDLQCIGNNEHKSSAEEQYVAWFNGLSILVRSVDISASATVFLLFPGHSVALDANSFVGCRYMLFARTSISRRLSCPRMSCLRHLQA